MWGEKCTDRILNNVAYFGAATDARCRVDTMSIAGADAPMTRNLIHPNVKMLAHFLTTAPTRVFMVRTLRHADYLMTKIRTPPQWAIAAAYSRGLWDHLERAHNLPGLSKQSVANNKKIWLMVHARMHGMRTGFLGVDHDELPHD